MSKEYSLEDLDMMFLQEVVNFSVHKGYDKDRIINAYDRIMSDRSSVSVLTGALVVKASYFDNEIFEKWYETDLPKLSVFIDNLENLWANRYNAEDSQ